MGHESMISDANYATLGSPGGARNSSCISVEPVLGQSILVELLQALDVIATTAGLDV